MKLLALISIAFSLSYVSATDCYYCGVGNTTDVLQLLNVYGKAELQNEENGQARAFNGECGKSDKKTLKVCVLVCPVKLFIDC